MLIKYRLAANVNNTYLLEPAGKNSNPRSVQFISSNYKNSRQRVEGKKIKFRTFKYNFITETTSLIMSSKTSISTIA